MLGKKYDNGQDVIRRQTLDVRIRFSRDVILRVLFILLHSRKILHIKWLGHS